MKRILHILLFSVILGLGSSAQQIEQYTQYFLNDYLINPAVAGSRDRIEFRGVNRYQWEGVTDAPRTFSLSVTSPLSDERIALGMHVLTDIVGPTRRIGAQGSFAYRIPMNDDLTMAVGISVGLTEYSSDGDKITLQNPTDEALAGMVGRKRVMDAKAGIYLQHDDFYVGLSAPQVNQSNVDVFSETSAGQSRLETHLIVHGGYLYDISEEFTLEPNVMLRFIDPAPVKLDFSLRVRYKDMIWLGGGLRTNDSFAAMLGLRWNNRLVVGYAHDFTTSDLSGYTNGTHEVMLGFDLPHPK